jgi:alcohol dehydrogenase (NADP+)
MKSITLRQDIQMPALGLGTWKAQGQEVVQAILEAIKMGYRHIDTAMIYDNEVAVGQAIAMAINMGFCSREDLFITSKLWNDRHEPHEVLPALEASLDRLKIDYLDLYLIHWPIAFKSGVVLPESSADYLPLDKAPLVVTWQAMLQAKHTGLTRSVGVSNFTVGHLRLLEECDSMPVVNQVEMHPLLSQEKLRTYCQDKGITLTAYAPLGSTDRAAGMKSSDEPNLFGVAGIEAMAKKYSCSPAQILISYHICRGDSVIPKAVQTSHLADNLMATEIDLEPNDIQTLSNLNKDYRFINGHFFDCPEQGYNWVFGND